MIDRYGGPGGKFLSPAGTPFEQRALAPHSELEPYHKYQVLKSFSVQAGEIAPWFDQPGGGTQYYIGGIKVIDDDGKIVEIKSIKQLEDYGYIEEIIE